MVGPNINLNSEASSGVNVSSTVASTTPAAVTPMPAESCVEIAILPNGAKPAGCTDFFNSFMYSDMAALTLTS